MGDAKQCMHHLIDATYLFVRTICMHAVATDTLEFLELQVTQQGCIVCDRFAKASGSPCNLLDCDLFKPVKAKEAGQPLVPEGLLAFWQMGPAFWHNWGGCVHAPTRVSSCLVAQLQSTCRPCCNSSVRVPVFLSADAAAGLLVC